MIMDESRTWKELAQLLNEWSDKQRKTWNSVNDPLQGPITHNPIIISGKE